MEYPKIKRGRPRTLNIIDIKEYQKSYYELNKEKTKGDFPCDICKCNVSKSNKSRHMKSSNHLNNRICQEII